MTKEQLFDFLCEHFGQKEVTAESLVYQYFYEFLVQHSIKVFETHLILMYKRFKNETQNTNNLSEFLMYGEYQKVIVRIMTEINQQTGKEIFTPWLY